MEQSQLKLDKITYETNHQTYLSSKDLGFVTRARPSIPHGCSDQPLNFLSSFSLHQLCLAILH
jgi:hypothetical protein